MELFAFDLVDAYNSTYYTIHGPENEEGKAFYLDYIEDHALTKLPVNVTTKDTLVVLSTCTEDITNGRFILVGKLVDKTFDEHRDKNRTYGIGLLNSTGFWALLPMWKWFILFAILLLLLIYAVLMYIDYRTKHKEQGKE